jgi:hypothetical protein
VLAVAMAGPAWVAGQSPGATESPPDTASAPAETNAVETASLPPASGLEPPGGPVLGEAVETRWRVAARMIAVDGDAKDILVTLPIPQDWPEQSVVVEEEIVPPAVTEFEPRELKTAPRQMVARMSELPRGETATFSLTYNVAVRPISPPADPSLYQVPAKLARELQDWVDESPGITYRDSKIRNQAKELADGASTAWDQIVLTRQWIRDNIQPLTEDQTDTTVTLKSRSGTSEDRVRLMVAFLRASKIPARMVWADLRTYCEFWLEDDAGNGFWFPCHVDGDDPVGASSRPEVILQKGDHFRVPEKKREILNFVNGFASARGSARPEVGFAEGPVKD